jgi:uncharacterized protein YodC (DUF2158 family)
MSDINVGNTVRLKSGGPIMTVQHIGSYSNPSIADGAKCVWFDEKDNPREKVFNRAVLEKVEPSDIMDVEIGCASGKRE